MATAKVPAAWLDNHGYDLMIVNSLRAEGIPATEIWHGHIKLDEKGTLTHSVDGDVATFEWTPEAEEPTATEEAAPESEPSTNGE